MDQDTVGGRPARLSVGVVSAGRVGAVIGAAWAAAGHRVVAASGVSRSSASRAATLLPGVALRDPDEVARGADLVLLAVPDDVLGGLVRGLAAAEVFRPGQIVVHTSGAHGVTVLDPAAQHGVLPLALHPVMTFTGRVEDVARLAGASAAVTAASTDEAAWSVGEALVVEMGAEPVRVTEDVRPLYHAALAHGANHLITLVRDCVAVLEQAGVHPAERLVAPLLSAALDNALRLGDLALTGPVARGDAGTVALHLRELSALSPSPPPSPVAGQYPTGDRSEPGPELAAAYRVLAGRTLRRAAGAGLLPAHATAAVEEALADTGGEPT